MTFRILLFGLLRPREGDAEFAIESEAQSPRELYAELNSQGLLSYPFEQVRCAIADEFADPDAPLSDGDKVAFLPPMAGG